MKRIVCWAVAFLAVPLCILLAACSDAGASEPEEEKTLSDQKKEELALPGLDTEKKMAFVDMGKNVSVLWGTKNLGALNARSIGLFYAWGDITGWTALQVENHEHKFDQHHHPHWEVVNGNAQSLKKYTSDVRLEQKDDAANNENGSWRMPTLEEVNELIQNCTIEYIDCIYRSPLDDEEEKGVIVKITSKENGNSIIIPAAAYCSNYKFFSDGYQRCCFWTASREGSGDGDSAADSYFVDMAEDDKILKCERAYGYNVRPVCEK